MVSVAAVICILFSSSLRFARIRITLNNCTEYIYSTIIIYTTNRHYRAMLDSIIVVRSEPSEICVHSSGRSSFGIAHTHADSIEKRRPSGGAWERERARATEKQFAVI